jgi:hypothetical protein
MIESSFGSRIVAAISRVFADAMYAHLKDDDSTQPIELLFCAAIAVVP